MKIKQNTIVLKWYKRIKKNMKLFCKQFNYLCSSNYLSEESVFIIFRYTIKLRFIGIILHKLYFMVQLNMNVNHRYKVHKMN